MALKHGDILTDEAGNKYEVAHISTQQDNNGNEVEVSYDIRTVEAMDAQRKLNEESAERERIAAEERAKADEEAARANAEATAAAEQPTNNQE